jgi:hypothetical protein
MLPAVSNSSRMFPVPAILSKLSHFLSEAIRSRLAWLLVFLHAAWFLLTIANMSPPSRDVADFIEHSEWSSATAILAGRPFHYHYESLSLQILFFVDLPSSLAAIPVGFLALPFLKLFHLGLYEGSYVSAGILLAVSALQWLTIGYIADKCLGSTLWGPSALLRINRSFVVLTILIFLFTAISVPIVNARSRRLSYRRSGISFHQ